eukprot:CAMPEP_0202924946 /NCGR_PEP_ID=MMETSP1392-20130828/79244_1 /ASSEMBLY_ACC=CAM_ASM_000868 /TAXON_ID=225041 /ORGANISM="Chlamydomonas chlamydogama, Strain SAG 11-48b" /LENGTH=91 /DNA_ID=CAMNT_0049618705 /DNA_START=171 /DNA_END=447 /DNA_ORIENTATION=-
MMAAIKGGPTVTFPPPQPLRAGENIKGSGKGGKGVVQQCNACKGLGLPKGICQHYAIAYPESAAKATAAMGQKAAKRHATHHLKAIACMES